MSAEKVVRLPGAMAAGRFAAGPDAELHRFEHRGQRWTLFKRAGRPGWYIKVTRSGKQRLKSLETPLVKPAVVKARKWLDAILDERWEDAEALASRPTRVATIGDVRDAYWAHAREFDEQMQPESIVGNGRKLVRLIETALGCSEREALRQPVTVLDADLVDKFRANWLAAAGADRAAAESRKRSGFSLLVMARACFKSRVMGCFRGLDLPDLEEFRKAPNFQTRPPVNVELSREEIRAVFRASLELRRSNHALYVVHLLFRHAGLRNSEIEAMRWDWIEPASGARPACVAVVAREDFVPKRSEGRVPLAPWVVRELARIRGAAPPSAHVVPGSVGIRARIIDREHSAWIGRVIAEAGGPRRRKTSYELRRWAAGVVRDRQGRDAAEQFLRHAPPADAGRFYMNGVFPWQKIEPITLRDARGVA